MGTMQHDVIVATISIESVFEKVHDWIKKLHKDEQRYFVFAPPVTNGYRTIICIPDGSKEGWADSNKGIELRAAFTDFLQSTLYDDGSSPVDWIHCSFGEYGQALVAGSNIHKSLMLL